MGAPAAGQQMAQAAQTGFFSRLRSQAVGTVSGMVPGVGRVIAGQAANAVASFDAENRMIGGPERAADLYGQVMGPGEERVIRVYFAEQAISAICSETGDIIPPSQLQSHTDELRKSNLIAEIHL